MSRVLIIDDDAGARQIFPALLRLDGHEVTTAAHGPAGFALAVAEPFDVILVDLHLAHESGIDVTKELRARGSRAAIVVITAFPDLDCSFDPLGVGAVGYVNGVLIGDEVSEVVRQALNGPFPVRHPSRRSGPRQSDALRASSGLGGSPLDPRIRHVLQTLNATPETSIDAVARRVELGESRLRHLFTESVGVPLARFVADQRLRIGARLLTSSFVRIEEVAQRVGMSNFRKAFRARFGMSPSTYRARFRLPGDVP
jgi:YesN/AraC family two-component response regulator